MERLQLDDDLDIERAAREFGSVRQLPEKQILEFTAKWKAARFHDLTGFDVKFPVGLTVAGACDFVETSRKNQWLLRKCNKRSGVDDFIYNTFGHILKKNNIPVSLIRYSDKELYKRVINAHATKLKLPNGIIYDIIEGERGRPRMKPTASLAFCGLP